MDLGSIVNKKLLQTHPVVKKQERYDETKKQGRPSFKQPEVKYTKVSVDIPEEIVFQMKEALITKFRGKHKTQSELIHNALLNYLNH